MLEREEDGRSIAEIPAIPGALCYAASKEEALVKGDGACLAHTAGAEPRRYPGESYLSPTSGNRGPSRGFKKWPKTHWATCLPCLRGFRFTCGALRAFWPSLTGTITLPPHVPGAQGRRDT